MVPEAKINLPNLFYSLALPSTLLALLKAELNLLLAHSPLLQASLTLHLLSILLVITQPILVLIDFCPQIVP